MRNHQGEGRWRKRRVASRRGASCLCTAGYGGPAYLALIRALGGAHRRGLDLQQQDELQQGLEECTATRKLPARACGLRSQARGTVSQWPRPSTRPRPPLARPHVAPPTNSSSLNWTVSPVHPRETSLRRAVVPLRGSGGVLTPQCILPCLSLLIPPDALNLSFTGPPKRLRPLVTPTSTPPSVTVSLG